MQGGMKTGKLANVNQKLCNYTVTDVE